MEILNETLDIGGLLQEKVPSRVIQDGKINEQRLLEIEKESQRNPEDSEKQNLYRSALGESVQWHLKQNHQAAALSVLEHYLLLEPEDLQANLALSWLQIRQGQYQQAENTLSRAKIKNENSSELNYLLGMAYYMQDKNSQASRALRQSLELKYRPQIEQLLKKVDQENWAENEYKQASSLHFVIRYEGNETNQTLGEGILGSLEKSFSELENQLNFSPREAIAVVLYPDEVFRDVTKTPSWVSALNDGKIRFPIKGLSTIDGNVQQILKHELTHSFIRLKSGGNCPLWLNEGLAQYLSGDTSRQFLPMAKQMLAQKRIPLLSSMQGSFMSMAAAQVVWAYQESLLATEFVAKTHGIEDIQRLLHLTGVTGNFERAARTILRKGYPELQQEFEDYIQSQ